MVWECLEDGWSFGLTNILLFGLKRREGNRQRSKQIGKKRKEVIKEQKKNFNCGEKFIVKKKQYLTKII